jgi:hypothetical protein
VARPSTRARCSFAQNRVMGTNSTKPRIVYTDPFYIRPIKVHARERVMGVLLLSVYLAFDCFRIRRSSGFRFFSRVGRACWVLQGECESVPLGATARSEDPPPAHTGFGSRRPPARTKRTKSQLLLYRLPRVCPELAPRAKGSKPRACTHPELRKAGGAR